MIRGLRRCLIAACATALLSTLVACGSASMRDTTMTATAPPPPLTPRTTATVSSTTIPPTPSEPETPTSSAATATPPPSGDTGIDGYVTIGPTCPVERVDSPCPDRPYAAHITIWRNQSMVADAHSDANGRFTALLPPGTYRVVGESGSTFPHGTEVTVTVVDGHLAPVQIRFDSGIR